MMDNLQKYKPTDKMIDLISDNYSLLQVMSRLELSLGFGDKTVKRRFVKLRWSRLPDLLINSQLFMAEAFPGSME